MQFQADILGRPVLRSGNEELSAIGAAWLAGLALGWWNDLAEIACIAPGVDRFTPAIESSQRERLYSGWKTAVARARLQSELTIMSSAADQIVLEARGITKRYPGTIALDDVTMRIHRHHVNVLIGENGAGKSTLMRILAGRETADSANCCWKEHHSRPVAARGSSAGNLHCAPGTLRPSES